MRIDLNADLGEGCPNDAALLEIVSSANIACGWHAGNARTMEATVREAMARGVSIGAHPSYPDRDGFGRREMARSAGEVYDDVRSQLRALDAVVRRFSTRIAHVKAHGALYNRAAKDRAVADAISHAVRDFDPHLAIVGLAGGEQIRSARAFALAAHEEVFADRAYAEDGTLIPRGTFGATTDDPKRAAFAAWSFVQRGIGDTICVHGDGPNALELARAVRTALTEHGVEIRCVTSPSS